MFSSVNLQYCRPDVKCVAFDTVCYVVSSTSARVYHQELVKMLHNAGDKYRYGEHPGNNLGLYQLSDSIKTLIALAVYFFSRHLQWPTYLTRCLCFPFTVYTCELFLQFWGQYLLPIDSLSTLRLSIICHLTAHYIRETWYQVHTIPDNIRRCAITISWRVISCSA